MKKIPVWGALLLFIVALAIGWFSNSSLAKGCSKDPVLPSCDSIPSAPCPDDPRCVKINTAKQHIEAYAAWWKNVPIPLTTMDSINLLESTSGEDFDLTPTFAFLISAEDMINSFGFQICPGSVHSAQIRGYLGRVSNLGGQPRLHLYFTPVNSEGDDMPFEGAPKQYYVMDLVTPCPSLCDQGSSLYTSFIDSLPPSRRPSTEATTNN